MSSISIERERERNKDDNEVNNKKWTVNSGPCMQLCMPKLWKPINEKKENINKWNRCFLNDWKTEYY